MAAVGERVGGGTWGGVQGWQPGADGWLGSGSCRVGGSRSWKQHNSWGQHSCLQQLGKWTGCGQGPGGEQHSSPGQL